MKIEDIPPLIDLVEEKEIEGVLVEVLRVKRRNLALYIIEREGRKESVFHYKQLASQIPIGSEIKICFDEKGPQVYWRPGRLQVEKEIKELKTRRLQVEKEIKELKARIKQLKRPKT